MSVIRIAPANPLDLRPEDVEDLAEDLREAGYQVEIDAEIRQRGYGVTWYEVLTVAIPAAIAIGQAMTSITRWAWDRLKKQEDEQRREYEEEEAKKPRRGGRRRKWEPNPRHKHVTIYGPDGEVLRELIYKKSGEEPEDVTGKKPWG